MGIIDSTRITMIIIIIIINIIIIIIDTMEWTWMNIMVLSLNSLSENPKKIINVGIKNPPRFSKKKTFSRSTSARRTWWPPFLRDRTWGAQKLVKFVHPTSKNLHKRGHLERFVHIPPVVAKPENHHRNFKKVPCLVGDMWFVPWRKTKF